MQNKRTQDKEEMKGMEEEMKEAQERMKQEEEQRRIDEAKAAKQTYEFH